MAGRLPGHGFAGRASAPLRRRNDACGDDSDSSTEVILVSFEERPTRPRQSDGPSAVNRAGPGDPDLRMPRPRLSPVKVHKRSGVVQGTERATGTDGSLVTGTPYPGKT